MIKYYYVNLISTYFLHSMVLGFDNLENHISERISSKRKENKFTTNDNKAQGDGISSSSSTFTSMCCFYIFLICKNIVVSLFYTLQHKYHMAILL